MIKAVGHRILVEKEDIEKETEGGIILVQDERLEKHRMNVGTVVSMGSKAYKAYSKDYDGEPWCEEGDKVLFTYHAGMNVVDPTTGKEFTMLNDDDVCAVVVAS